MNNVNLIKYEMGVAVITINSPETRNAISDEEVLGPLIDNIECAAADESTRVIILTGSNGVFSSGGNVKKMAKGLGIVNRNPAITRYNYKTSIQRLPLIIESIEIPIIAAVNGPAIGAGCDLALMCDLRIASKNATFAESFVKLGIVPGDGGAWLLPRVVGFAKACEMALTGDTISAEEAQSIGLVSKVVEENVLFEESLNLAKRIASNPTHAVRMTRRLLREAGSQRLDQFLELSAAFQAIAHTTEDHHEAIAALIERRPPRLKCK